MAINCYSWAKCSCPAFEKLGYACKHLWAFRFAIAQMHTPYAFIFPETFEQVHKIYSTIFIPPTPSTSTMDEHQIPSLVNESLRPLPLSNPLAETSDDFNEILVTIPESSEDSVVSDTEENADTDEDQDDDISNVESELDELNLVSGLNELCSCV